MLDRLYGISYCSLILIAGLAATSSFAANPDKGETLAKRWCTGCHLVAADQKKTPRRRHRPLRPLQSGLTSMRTRSRPF